MTDFTIKYIEEMVGSGHPTKADTINRLALIEHKTSGEHSAIHSDDIITKGPEVDIRAFLPSGFVTDGSVDYSAEIQAAIDSTQPLGGKVIFPAGIYGIGANMTLYPNLCLDGLALGSSTIQTLVDGVSWSGVDCDYLSLQNLIFKGPGISATSGGGISLTRVGRANIYHMDFRNVIIRDTAQTGLFINTPILSNFTNVKAISCAGDGIKMFGGTSVTLDNCYGITTTQAAIKMDGMSYSLLTGCATEVAGIGYELVTCNNVSLISCGAESQVNRSPSYPGTGFKINGGIGNSLISCSSTGTPQFVVDVLTETKNLLIDGFRSYGVLPATELNIQNAVEPVIVTRSNFTNIADPNVKMASYLTNVTLPPFGTWVTKVVGTTYLAPTDGFVKIHVDASVYGSSGSIILYTDANAAPATARGWASAQTSAQVLIKFSGDLIPIRAGEYYKAVIQAAVGSPTFSVLWMPKA